MTAPADWSTLGCAVAYCPACAHRACRVCPECHPETGSLAALKLSLARRDRPIETRPARPFPRHDPRCPFQRMPLGSECECGQAEAEYRGKFGPRAA